MLCRRSKKQDLIYTRGLRLLAINRKEQGKGKTGSWFLFMDEGTFTPGIVDIFRINGYLIGLTCVLRKLKVVWVEDWHMIRS